MTVVVLVPLLVCIVGALMFALASNPKIAEMGKILFAVGAFWSVYLASGTTWHLGGRP